VWWYTEGGDKRERGATQLLKLL